MSITDELREYAAVIADKGSATLARLERIADGIDLDHERRMEQAKREVRRTMARDMRWATTMLEARESRRHIREGLEGGPND